MKERKILTWLQAEEFFLQEMDEYRERVRAALQAAGRDYVACWELFLRVWNRKRERGKRLIRQALWKQTKQRRKGPIATRNFSTRRKPGRPPKQK